MPASTVGAESGLRGENDAPGAKLQKMLRCQVARAAVVDANQIVRAAMRVRQDAAVQQNDRNPRLFERPNDAVIHFVLRNSQLQGAKKTPATLWAMYCRHIRQAATFFVAPLEFEPPRRRTCPSDWGDAAIPSQMGSKISVSPRSGISRPNDKPVRVGSLT